MAKTITPGERIRETRLSRRLTAAQLGAKCFCSARRIYQLERMTQDANPQTKTIELIAAALGVSPAWIMGWEEEKEETHEPQYEQI